MPAIIAGLLSAIIGAVLTAFAGHGPGMIFLAYTLCGIAGLLLGAWRQVILAERNHARKSGVNKPFIASKNKL